MSKDGDKYKQITVKLLRVDYERLIKYGEFKGGLGLTALIRLAISDFLEHNEPEDNE